MLRPQVYLDGTAQASILLPEDDTRDQESKALTKSAFVSYDDICHQFRKLLDWAYWASGQHAQVSVTAVWHA